MGASEARRVLSPLPGTQGFPEDQTSNPSPGIMLLNAGPFATHRTRPGDRKATSDGILVSLHVGLTRRRQELWESWQAPHLSLPQLKFSKGQEGHLHGTTQDRGALKQGGEASMGNCGQGPYKKENSVSRNARCQLESADPSG